MGTWDKGAFDNDAAADLVDDLGHTPDLARRAEILRRALDAVVANDDYLDYDDAAAGVAAAVLVARARSGLVTLVEGPLEVPRTLVPLAVAALDRLIDDDSEWRQLWAETGDLDEVLAGLATQRRALISAG